MPSYLLMMNHPCMIQPLTANLLDHCFICQLSPRSCLCYEYLEPIFYDTQRVLRYVHGTLSYGINYSGGDILAGYSDADWAGCIETRRSTLGYCFMLGGSIISWKYQKQ